MNNAIFDLDDITSIITNIVVDGECDPYYKDPYIIG